MDNLHIDFETYSPEDIKLGAYKYSEHPETEVLMCSYKLNGGETKLWVNMAEEMCFDYIYSPFVPPELQALLDDPTVLIWAQNVGFEKAILENVLSFNIDSDRYRCTAALGRSVALHGDLEGLAIDLELVEQKDKAGKLLITKFCKPRKPTKNNPLTRITAQDDPDAFLELCRYCVQDTKTESAIHERLKAYEFKGDELRIFQLDTKLNGYGLPFDLPSIENGLEIVRQYVERETIRFRELSGGINPTQRDRVQELINKMLLSITPFEAMQLDLGDEQDAAHYAMVKKDAPAMDPFKAIPSINAKLPEGMPPLTDLRASTIDEWLKENKRLKGCAAYEMLKIKRSVGRSSTKKLITMLNASGAGDRVRGTLCFHGATTGRWAGRIVQPQNLPRPTIKDTMGALEASNHLGLEDIEFLYGDPMAAIASVIRHYICAPEGRELIVADYTAIEARVLCWLAGQSDAVRLFQREVDARREWQDGKIPEAEYLTIKVACDPYIEMACIVLDRTPQEVEDLGGRQLGKAIILGCGYQMGGGTFFTTCENWGMAVTEELAGRCVKAYREKYGRVKALWEEIQDAAIKAVHKPETVVSLGVLKFKMTDGFLFVRLPSGRKLAYPRPRVVLKKKWGRAMPCLEFYGKNDKTVHWGMKDTYGGKLTENICQAIARDVMGVGMLNAEEKGYTTLTSIHDEAVAEVAQGEGTVLEYERLLCKMPDWAKGIPLASEGYRSKRYRK